MLKLCASGSKYYMQVVRDWEEVKYKLRLSVLVERLMSNEVDKVFPSVFFVSSAKVFLETTFDIIWFCANHQYWTWYQDFEMRIRLNISLVLSIWYNLEVHEIPETILEYFFAPFYGWRGLLETSRHLLVPITPIFDY